MIVLLGCRDLQLIFLCDCNSVLLSCKKERTIFFEKGIKITKQTICTKCSSVYCRRSTVFDETNNVPESRVNIRHYCLKVRI